MLDMSLKIKMSIFICYNFFFLFFPLLVVGLDNCPTTWCRKDGPSIHFPFRHKFLQPKHCGYSGFNVYCDKSNETVLELPFSVKLAVKKIDYVSQQITLHDPDGCLIQKILNLNLSTSRFHFLTDELYNYSLFNCSSTKNDLYYYNYVPCLDVPGYQVLDIYPYQLINSYPLSSCTKIHEISSIPPSIRNEDELLLHWSEPFCGDCEAQGNICSLNAFTKGIQCTNKPNTNKWEPRTSFVAEIKRITNQFSEKLGEGGYGTVYKGKLSNEIFVAVKILHNLKGNGEEFINEVGIIGRIHHVNVVRLVGYCADGFRRALMYEFLPNDSLEKFIFRDSSKKNTLGWNKLHDIALGIAKGIEYLHQGCDQQILHFDIKPHNILLDQNFNPKICDFGLAKLCSKEQSGVSMTAARGTMGYIAPELLSRNFGRVSYKSDVYSFGMLLLEMVGGRKNNDLTANTSQVYFPEWISKQLSEGEELRIRIEEDNDATILKKLAIVGLWCIQWYPRDRPSMKVVVQMLEGDEDDLTMPPHPVPSTNGTTSTMHGRPRQTELEAISELE